MSDKTFTAFFTSLIWFMAMGLLVAIWGGTHRLGYEQYGSKGHACFANKTCRESLKCLSADGIDPVCVGVTK